MLTLFMIFLFWRIVMLILLIALVVFIVCLVMRAQRHDGGHKNEKRLTPLEIAKIRYARGEISREQFESLKKDLKE